ncbi:MAG: AI-2E family transporter [Deltaproteobacteria bacterium]|nr:AI-2E family transporter [Deltaproteobacteria bacterium]
MRAPPIRARGLLAAAALVVVIAGLKAAAPWVLPSLLGLLAAIFSLPLLRWLQARHFPRVPAVLATTIIDLAVVLVLLGVVGGSIAQFVSEAPRYEQRFMALFTGLFAPLEARGFHVNDSLVEALQPSSLVPFLEGLLAGVGGIVSQALIIFLIMLFTLLEADQTAAKLVSLASRGDPKRVHQVRSVLNRLQRYLGFKTGMGLVDGVLTACFTVVMGVEFAPLWGLLTFVLYFLPSIGSILATIPPVIVALLQIGPGRALVLLVGYTVLHTGLNTILEPRLVGRSFGLSPLAAFVSVPFFGWMWGPVGMLLGVPLLMVMQIVCDDIPELRWVAVLLGARAPQGGPPPPSGREATVEP